MKTLIRERIADSISCKSRLMHDEESVQLIDEISSEIVDVFRARGKVIVAGNGGSFADAFHIVGELVGRFMFDRDALPAIALGGNNSVLTAIGNDYSFKSVFSRELYALGEERDLFLAISTSGNSPSILEAIGVALRKDMKVYGLSGEKGGAMKNLCKCVRVPSESTARIQESHIMIGHIICEIVEKKVFGDR